MTSTPQSTNGPPAHPPLARPKNSGWLWYFVILAVLAVAATVILIAYNLSQQLQPEQLAAAKQQWKEHGPKSYHLIYKIRIDNEDKLDRYDVRVKNGKVERALVNGVAQPEVRFYYYGMEALFRDVERFLQLDQKQGAPRTYLRAKFDPQTGALVSFVRRVMGSKQRVAIEVESFEPQ